MGLSPNFIVSLAYRAYENGKLVRKGEIICNPDYPISESASKVNGFTNELVKDKPLFVDEWDGIKEFFDSSIWIGHNLQYDARAIKTEAERYGFKVPVHMNLCTLKNAKRLIPKDKVENYKLETLIDYFQVKVNSSKYHTAEFDIWATMKVYNKLVELANGELLIELPK